MPNNIIMADAKESANSIPFELYEYTHGEDWLTDEKGNAIYVFRTYCINGNGVYYMTVDNTFTGQYAAISAYKSQQMIGSFTYSSVHRKGYADNGSPVSTTSFRIGAGSKVHVLFIPSANIINAIQTGG